MDELTKLGSHVGELLKSRNQTVGISESSCGGLLSAALISVPGASAFFLGGGVIYTLEARRALMEVSDDQTRGMRSASEPYAQLMAQTAREKLGAVWGLSETGATGPTGNRYGDAAGHACLAVAGPVSRVTTLETGSAEREENMWEFARAALALFADCIAES